MKLMIRRSAPRGGARNIEDQSGVRRADMERLMVDTFEIAVSKYEVEEYYKHHAMHEEQQEYSYWATVILTYSNLNNSRTRPGDAYYRLCKRHTSSCYC